MGAIEKDEPRAWWALTTLVPFGFLSPAGFAYAAYRARKPGWYVAAVLWGLLAYVAVAWNSTTVEDSDLDGFTSVLMMAAWVGSGVHALVARGEYKRRVKAAATDPVLSARKRLRERRRAQELASKEPELARELGVGRPDVPGAESMGAVDVNHAPESAIATLPGVDRELARRIHAAARELRGFESVDDLGNVLELHPDTVERLRGHTVFLP